MIRPVKLFVDLKSGPESQGGTKNNPTDHGRWDSPILQT